MKSKRRLIVLNFIVLGISNWLFAGSYNIALNAKAEATSELNNNFLAGGVNDGIITIDGKGEWAGKGISSGWGYMAYHAVTLTWNEPQTINKIVLYDRVSLEEHTAGGSLIFSDGSEVIVTQIPNNGTGKLIEFPAKTVEWIKFKINDGLGLHLGLSEIEVFPAHDSYPDHLSWVDPFIETNRGRYLFFATGSLPMGMISAAPQTRNKNQYGGGYNYNSDKIQGFVQIHNWSLSGIEIIPTTGKVDATKGEKGWESEFSHNEEIAQPGYHRVYLQKYKTWVEQTSTDRVSFYRMKFTEKEKANILFNVGGYLGNSSMIEADVKKVSDNGIEGFFVSTGRCWGGPDKIKVYFVAEFDKPFKQLNGWDHEKMYQDIEDIKGSDWVKPFKEKRPGATANYTYYHAHTAGVSAEYDVEPGDEILVKISISYTSVQNARNNLLQECEHWDFEKVRQDARNSWNEALGKIDVKGGTNEQKTKFYTDIWHVLLGRHKVDDFSGDYPDYTQSTPWWGNHSNSVFRKGTVPKDENGQPKHHMYNHDALWLTHWNQNVIWGMAYPDILDNFSAGLVEYAKVGYLLPRGMCGGGYTRIMSCCPATSMIVSAYMRDVLTKTDPGFAYKMIKQNHEPGGMLNDEERLNYYKEHGFFPQNAGQTIEANFQDWGAAQMAFKLGKKKDYRYFLKRSKGWEQVFHPEHKMILPKDWGGNWIHTDLMLGKGFVESNSWQTTFSLSHDIDRLAELMGGNDSLAAKLNYAFEKAAPDNFLSSYTKGYVSYANQPGVSGAHVFNYVGKPWLTQYWVRQVNEKAYGGTNPNTGYGGHDEDQGQMGGNSALMSIGLHSLRGAESFNPVYDITSPVFDEVTFKLDQNYYSGKEFKIKTYNNSKENYYIQKAKLNGMELNQSWFRHADFVKGGVLELWLGDTPNKEWGLESISRK